MRRIAIVDDSFGARYLMRMLVGIHHDVYTYPTGPDFLCALESDVFDLVIVDIILPGGLDGVAVGAAVRAKYPPDRLPIIALSADTRPETQKAALAVGIDAYVTKPLTDFEAFLGLIDSYLNPPTAA